MSAENVPAWASKYPEEIERCIAIALSVVQSDTSLRVPRTEEERQNAFANWLATWRAKYDPVIRNALQKEQPALLAKLSPGRFDSLLEQYVWPPVESWLRSYALRGQAAAWTIQHLGDALTIGQPELQHGCWYVPLGLKGIHEPLGHIVLDQDGMVIPVLTSSRQALLQKAHDRTVPPTTTAAG